MPNRPKKSKNMSEEKQEVQEAQAPEVNIGDFGAILQIIDVASTRGAFKGAELSSVGAIRDRVAAFVEYYTPKEEEKDGEEAAGDEAATDGAEVTEETSE
jgi:hypothetical protein